MLRVATLQAANCLHPPPLPGLHASLRGATADQFLIRHGPREGRESPARAVGVNRRKWPNPSTAHWCFSPAARIPASAWPGRSSATPASRRWASTMASGTRWSWRPRRRGARGDGAAVSGLGGAARAPTTCSTSRAFGAIGETAMTAEQAIEITEKGLPSTFVPGRNLVFLTYAAALADRLGLEDPGRRHVRDRLLRLSGLPARHDRCDGERAGARHGARLPDQDAADAADQGRDLGAGQGPGRRGPGRADPRATATPATSAGATPMHDWGAGCGACPACELRANGWHDWVRDGGRRWPLASMTYSVKEIFLTLQGEGGQAGRAAVFCRFAGCNLWSGPRAGPRQAPSAPSATPTSSGSTAPGGGKFAHRRGPGRPRSPRPGRGPPENRLVVLTGGEPLLQLDAPLIEALHAAGFSIAVETNGTIAAPRRRRLDLRQPQGRRAAGPDHRPGAEAGLSAGRRRSGPLRAPGVRALLAAADGRAGPRGGDARGHRLLPRPPSLAFKPADAQIPRHPVTSGRRPKPQIQ